MEFHCDDTTECATMMEPKERERISRYLALDEDELYSLIPPYLGGIVLYSPSGMIEAGKAFCERKYSELREVVCGEFDWPVKRKDPIFNDNVALVAAVAQALMSHTESVPPAILATLLVKKGLDSLCKGFTRRLK
jgi:hypothetical protein